MDVFHDGAEIQVRIDLPDPEKVHVQLDALKHVVFEDEPVKDFIDANSVMRGMVKFVKDRVIPCFEPFF